jgi:quercetin dioxygenase-like cupin family protein
MHVTPSDLRMVRQDGIVIRFALLDTMAFVLAEIPASGSRGTPMDQPCVRPHWGFVIAGELEFERDGRSETLKPGSAFHVPPGEPAHRFVADGAARVASFELVDPAVDVSDTGLAAKGFEVLGPEALGAATFVPATPTSVPEARQIDVRAWSMSSLILAQARFGPGSGYTAEWCDAPHWGLVTSGRIAIESEDDIEVLAAGDVYHCPAGPPGHRFEAADPASVIDLTPVDLPRGTRVAQWRTRPAGADPAGSADQPIAVARFG